VRLLVDDDGVDRLVVSGVGMTRVRIERSNFATTSSNVNGRPSWNRTPRRTWKVSARASSDSVHDSARAGTISPFRSNRTRPSKTFRYTTRAISWEVETVGSQPGGSAAIATTTSPP